MEGGKDRNAKRGEAIQISFGDEKKANRGESLQEAFKKFRKDRQKAIHLSKQVNEETFKWRADEQRMHNLRMRFVEQCKKYFGIPYAKKYQEPGTDEYNSPLFLDCCGLVRKALRDLKEDFGFEVGPWNQAYMFDTLPLDVKRMEDLKPGDLVFVSGIYHNPKSKKQRHNMVHVEVWAGDGEKTIGARWQRGKIQYHDSYKFNAKSYHSMQYHFKSIDTWLKGICQSHCTEHAWTRSKYQPGKKSIFAEDQANDTPDEDAEEDQEIDEQEKCGQLDSVDEENPNQNVVRHSTVTTTAAATFGEVSSSNNNSTAMITSQYPPKTFQDLDECVHWLVSKITVELANEISDEGDTSEFGLADSSYVMDKDFRHRLVDIPFVDQRTVEPFSSSAIPRSGCQCPQCCRTKVNCIHQESYDNEEEFGKLEDLKEISSSLECFDFIDSHAGDREVVSVIQCPNNSTGNSNNSRQSVSPSKAAKKGKDTGSGSSSGNGRGNEKNNNSKDTPHRNPRGGTRSVSHLNNKQPSFFIGGGNGNWMIESTLVSLGWCKLEDKMDESFKLKWVECKGQINYDSFREGEQLVNHISNINLLTTKLGLLCTLQEYQRVQEKMAKTPSKLQIAVSEFLPETYKLMSATEKLKFVNEVYKDGETWICKPTGMNQGKGIYLVSSKEQLTEKLNMKGGNESSTRRSQVRPPQGRIIQRYVMNPLLLNGFKFDVRTYMLIASTTPYIVFYHPGYVRLSCVPYTPYTQDAAGLHAHLTNQYVQKKHPMYSAMKEDTVWNFERLQSYFDEKYAKEKELPENWVYTAFTKRMHQIMTTCFHSIRQKLHRRTGTFDLLGFDFLIDEDFKVWLLEVNINPALHTNCQVLMDLIPGVVDETLKLVLEISDKTKRRRPIFPLENQKGFQLLYNGEGK